MLALIWVIDILNLGKDIGGFDLATLLDVDLPINTLAWIIVICLRANLKISSNV